jgi:hypothetical protein
MTARKRPPPAEPRQLSSRQRALGKQLLFYRPDGPLGGTFSCAECDAQGWQPELIDHRADCPYRTSPRPAASPMTLR